MKYLCRVWRPTSTLQRNFNSRRGTPLRDCFRPGNQRYSIIYAVSTILLNTLSTSLCLGRLKYFLTKKLLSLSSSHFPVFGRNRYSFRDSTRPPIVFKCSQISSRESRQTRRSSVTRVMVHNLIKISISPVQATNQPHCMSIKGKNKQENP